MKYFPITNTLFVKNRKHFIENMLDNSVAFFNSNDCYPVSADTTLPFEQHRDLFYLSGVNQEETILLVYKKNDSIGLNKSLFSAFVDYNASSDFTNVEEELVENLNYQITQDIFDKIFGGEW